MNKQIISKSEMPDSDYLMFPKALQELNVYRIENHVYFYEDITKESYLKFNIMMYDASKAAALMKGHECIVLHIDSKGGDALVGLNMYDLVKEIGTTTPIYTMNDGEVCSAATLPYLAGRERDMGAHSRFLIHQLSWGGFAKKDDMEDYRANVLRLEQQYAEIYAEETILFHDIENEKARIEAIIKSMRTEKALDFNECIDAGILYREPKLNKENQIRAQKYIDDLMYEQIYGKPREVKEAIDKKVSVKKSSAKSSTKSSSTKKTTKKTTSSKKKTPDNDIKEAIKALGLGEK